jgi:hypothetical protein
VRQPCAAVSADAQGDGLCTLPWVAVATEAFAYGREKRQNPKEMQRNEQKIARNT